MKQEFSDLLYEVLKINCCAFIYFLFFFSMNAIWKFVPFKRSLLVKELFELEYFLTSGILRNFSAGPLKNDWRDPLENLWYFYVLRLNPALIHDKFLIGLFHGHYMVNSFPNLGLTLDGSKIFFRNNYRYIYFFLLFSSSGLFIKRWLKCTAMPGVKTPVLKESLEKFL